MDPQSGGWAHVVSQPMAAYAITNDAVYYIPYEKRQVNDPAVYPADSKSAMYTTYASSIFACDHEGGNVRKVWTDDSGLIGFSTSFTVVDNTFYGWIKPFDPEENVWKWTRFTEISLDD